MSNELNHESTLLTGDKLYVSVRRDEKGHNDGSIGKEVSHGAYCIAKAPRYAEDEVWEANANKIIKALSMESVWRGKLLELGVCPECLEEIQHHLDEPFSNCNCGTGEDTGDMPELQRLRRVEAGAKAALAKLDSQEVAAARSTLTSVIGSK